VKFIRDPLQFRITPLEPGQRRIIISDDQLTQDSQGRLLQMPLPAGQYDHRRYLGRRLLQKINSVHEFTQWNCENPRRNNGRIGNISTIRSRSLTVHELESPIMKHGGLTDGAGQLKMAADKLEEAWEAARLDWNDVVSRAMEEEQIEPLLQQLRATLDAVSHTSNLLTTACRECEDERSG
jgi:hypothetical protein